jgi:hypothetical protein
VDDGVFWCDGWNGEVVVAEFDRVRGDQGLGDGIDAEVAAVVFEGDANVVTVSAVEVPGAADVGFVVDDDWATEGEDGVGVVIEGAVEMFPGRDGWIDCRLAEQVESEFNLSKEQIPEVAGEISGKTRDDGKEVGLEGLYGMFGGIAAMDMRGHELVSPLPCVFNCLLEVHADFIVKDVSVNDVSPSLEAAHDGVVGRDACPSGWHTGHRGLHWCHSGRQS